MRKLEKAELEVVKFGAEDIIATSVCEYGSFGNRMRNGGLSAAEENTTSIDDIFNNGSN